MKTGETRRIMPISMLTLVAVLALVVFEALVMGGALQIEASTIARIAPWAYEPFLRVVGEHPDQMQSNEISTNSVMEYAIFSDTNGVSAQNPVLADELDPNSLTNAVTVPVQEPLEQPETTETNLPAGPPDEVVPVG